MTLEDVWEYADKIGLIEGVELLDHHVPDVKDGDLNAGIKLVKEQVESYGWELYGLAPHPHLWRPTVKEQEAEVEKFKKWIDLAADNSVPSMRAQVGGDKSNIKDPNPTKGIEVAKKILDEVLPYAAECGVKIGIETHWSFSSNPVYLERVTEHYKDKFPGSLGIIFDWGNFPSKDLRYKALEIAARPHNHCYSHTKIYRFGRNFQQWGIGGRRNYDSERIVQTFKKNGYKEYFSIEFEGSQSAFKGVYKSAHGVKYAMTDGEHTIHKCFNWKSYKKKYA